MLHYVFRGVCGDSSLTACTMCLSVLVSATSFTSCSYLPYDRTGDWFYQLTESLTFVLACTVVYLCRFRYRESYDASNDSLNHLFLIVPSVLLALIIHPTLNSFMPADVGLVSMYYLLFALNRRCLPASFRRPGRLRCSLRP